METISKTNIVPCPKKTINNHLRANGYPTLMRIGNGAHGTVYVSTCPLTKTGLAIKCIAISTDFQCGYSELTEIQILSTISHPNILKSVKKPSFFYYTDLDYNTQLTTVLYLELANCTLEAFLKKNYSIDTTLSVCSDIVEGLAHLHKNGFLHLDLKPTNILITKNNNKFVAKIADFGLSIGGISQLDITYGLKTEYERITAWYRPPENFYIYYVLLSSAALSDTEIKTSIYGGFSDIWSLGLIVLNAITNSYHYPDNTSYDYNSWIYNSLYVERKFNVTSMLPESVKKSASYDNIVSFLENCLKLDPLERISAVDCCKHPLFSTKQLNVLSLESKNNNTIIYPIITATNTNDDEGKVIGDVFWYIRKYNKHAPISLFFTFWDIFHRFRNCMEGNKTTNLSIHALSCLLLSFDLFGILVYYDDLALKLVKNSIIINSYFPSYDIVLKYQQKLLVEINGNFFVERLDKKCNTFARFITYLKVILSTPRTHPLFNPENEHQVLRFLDKICEPKYKSYTVEELPGHLEKYTFKNMASKL